MRERSPWFIEGTNFLLLLSTILSTLDSSRLIGATLKDANTGSTRNLEINGAIVMIGATPNTVWVKSVGVVLDDEGFIQLSSGNCNAQTSSKTQTSINGIFAAGEATDSTYKQAIAKLGNSWQYVNA